jgi:hypothetical protein
MLSKIRFETDELEVARAVLLAREIQEFLWADKSLSCLPFDGEAWRKVFQKRVDAIGEINATHPSAEVELRKRLLQQAALSIKALIALQTRGIAS